jgi:hypothetical protein
MTDKQLLEMALEALETCDWADGYQGEYQYFDTKEVDEAITAIRERLANAGARLKQPEQSAERGEPVAWLQIGLAPFHDGDVIARTTKPKEWNPEWWRFEPLYTTPPAAQPAPVARVEFTKRKKPDVEWLVDEVRNGTLLYTTPPAAQPAVPLEPVAWAGWHTSTDEMMLFKTKAEAVSWRDQYKKGFASIEGLVRQFLPAAPYVASPRAQEPPNFGPPIGILMKMEGDETKKLYPLKQKPEQSAEELRSVERGEPVAYPEGDVVGPCICGSWPGGKCLKCPRTTQPSQPAPVQEPVKLVAYNCKCGRTMKFESVNGVVAAQRQSARSAWVGLSDEEIKRAPHHMVDGAYHYSFKQGAEWAEAKLKEKNSV